MDYDESVVLEALRAAWSAESSSLWTAENPARGHCGVTALVIQDHFGGAIRKTMLPEGPHFYNVIDGERHDFTTGQFSQLPAYDDTPSSREEAFSDTNEYQYAVLSDRFENVIPE